MTRAMTLPNDRLGPYVLAFAAGAIALSTLVPARKVESGQADENAKARTAIADKLLDRLAVLYRKHPARPATH